MNLRLAACARRCVRLLSPVGLSEVLLRYQNGRSGYPLCRSSLVSLLAAGSARALNERVGNRAPIMNGIGYIYPGKKNIY